MPAPGGGTGEIFTLDRTGLEDIWQSCRDLQVRQGDGWGGEEAGGAAGQPGGLPRGGCRAGGGGGFHHHHLLPSPSAPAPAPSDAAPYPTMKNIIVKSNFMFSLIKNLFPTASANITVAADRF